MQIGRAGVSTSVSFGGPEGECVVKGDGKDRPFVGLLAGFNTDYAVDFQGDTPGVSTLHGVSHPNKRARKGLRDTRPRNAVRVECIPTRRTRNCWNLSPRFCLIHHHPSQDRMRADIHHNAQCTSGSVDGEIHQSVRSGSVTAFFCGGRTLPGNTPGDGLLTRRPDNPYATTPSGQSKTSCRPSNSKSCNVHVQHAACIGNRALQG